MASRKPSAKSWSLSNWEQLFKSCKSIKLLQTVTIQVATLSTVWQFLLSSKNRMWKRLVTSAPPCKGRVFVSWSVSLVKFMISRHNWMAVIFPWHLTWISWPEFSGSWAKLYLRSICSTCSCEDDEETTTGTKLVDACASHNCSILLKGCDLTIGLKAKITRILILGSASTNCSTAVVEVSAWWSWSRQKTTGTVVIVAESTLKRLQYATTKFCLVSDSLLSSLLLSSFPLSPSADAVLVELKFNSGMSWASPCTWAASSWDETACSSCGYNSSFAFAFTSSWEIKSVKGAKGSL